VINHIDVSTVLRRTVCDLYSNLVTRSTGAAVRSSIEQQLAQIRDRTLTVIDFSNVGLLDFSCADEIVAKLLLRYCAPAVRLGRELEVAMPDECQSRDEDARMFDPATAPHEGYFLFRGVNESHLDAIEAVLERHGLALVVEGLDGDAQLVGTLHDGERQAWLAVCQLGRTAASDLASAIGLGIDEAERVLDALCRRRLVMRLETHYVAVGGAH
jgi:hypothetical protein